MDYEFNNDGYISVRYEIAYINATYQQDREDLVGVCRLTGVEVECDGDVSSDIISEVQDKIFNYFAEDEHFTEDPSWRKKAEKDISAYTGVSNVNIDLE